MSLVRLRMSILKHRLAAWAREEQERGAEKLCREHAACESEWKRWEERRQAGLLETALEIGVLLERIAKLEKERDDWEKAARCWHNHHNEQVENAARWKKIAEMPGGKTS